MATGKTTRGRKKKAASARPRTASRKRKTAAASSVGRKKKAAPRKAAPKKAAPKKAAPKKKTRSAAPRKKTARGKKTVARKKVAGRSTTTRKKTARRKTPAAAPALVPSGIGMQLQHMDYTSHAMDEVRRFYTETLGFTEFTLTGDYLMVQTGASSSLGFMPPMPGPPDQWRPPREPALYFMVDDVDRVYHELTARGIEFDQAPQDTFWGHRLATLRDPEGRTVCMAHVIKT